MKQIESIMKKLFIIFCITAISLNCFAESVYTYDLPKDIIIGSVSLGLTVSSMFIKRSKNAVSESDIFSRDNVNAFDRGLMFEYNKPMDIFSNITVYSLIAMPVMSLAVNFKDASALITYGVMYGESLLFVFGTAEFLKNMMLRYRPYNYFGDVPAGNESDYFKSFPSRHTAFAFMSAGFLTSTFFAEYPDSPWKVPLCAAAYTLAVGVGASRIFSGNHFASDVLAGAAIGSLYGYLIPCLHLRKKQDGISLVPLTNGFLVSLEL